MSTHTSRPRSILVLLIPSQVPLKQGSTVALITPFDKLGNIDYETLRILLRFHVENGTDNLCILGTTGEASVMSTEERGKVLKTAVEEVKGKMPIMAGVGTINPNTVKAMTQQAIDSGCDAALVVTPYYVKPPQRCLIRHFTTCADYGLPVVIYNVPGRTSVNFLDENIAIAAEHPNIVALKDATGDVSRVSNIRKIVPDDFLLYSGDDGTSADFILQGGNGCISVTANVAPKAMHDMMMAGMKGNKDAVYRINEPLKALHKELFVESNPIPTKWAAMRMGLIPTAFCRPPLDEMDPKFVSDVERALLSAGLL